MTSGAWPQSWTLVELEAVASALRLLEQRPPSPWQPEVPVAVGQVTAGHAVWSAADNVWRFVPAVDYAFVP